MLLRSPFSLLSELVLFSRLWREDFSMVDQTGTLGEEVRGSGRGVSEELQHGPTPGFMHSYESTSDRNSRHPRGVRLELTNTG